MKVNIEFNEQKISLSLDAIENLFLLWRKYGRFTKDKLSELEEITFKL